LKTRDIKKISRGKLTDGMYVSRLD